MIKYNYIVNFIEMIYHFVDKMKLANLNLRFLILEFRFKKIKMYRSSPLERSKEVRSALETF